jgi:hypothetical protein
MEVVETNENMFATLTTIVNGLRSLGKTNSTLDKIRKML